MVWLQLELQADMAMIRACFLLLLLLQQERLRRLREAKLLLLLLPRRQHPHRSGGCVLPVSWLLGKGGGEVATTKGGGTGRSKGG